jgi:paraquat-inducible protein A
MTVGVIGCPDCGTRQRVPEHPSPSVAVRCVACAKALERTHGRSVDLAFACSAATLLLLVPSNLALFLRTDALGVSRESVLASAATFMLRDGWPWLALVVFLFVVLLPIVRFALLTAVLAAVRFGWVGAWTGPAFRWADLLQTWAMPDVFLLGLAVAYARLASSVGTTVGPGALCFIAAGVLSLFTRAALDHAEVWERIAPDPARGGATGLLCTHCDLVDEHAREGARCTRCRARLAWRKPDSINRTVALTAGAMLLYIPANIYPLATLPINYRPSTYTVLQGVIELAQNGLWDLAILVFTASFLIPILKLVGLTWCVLSVLRRSTRHLRLKTRTYRVVEEIGRWSMVDPFVIGAFVPVMDYNALIYGRAEPASVPFTAVVVLTIISAKTFDPRLMWDAARRAG